MKRIFLFCSIAFACSLAFAKEPVIALPKKGERAPSSATATPAPEETVNVAMPVGAITAPIGAPVERTVNRADVPFEVGKFTVGEVSDVTTKKPLGLGLAGITEGSTMAKLGFKDGDVLVSVNGHAMLKVSDIDLLAKSLKVSKFHDYQVRRAEESMKWKVVFVEGAATVQAPKPVPMADAKPERTIKIKKEKLKGTPIELDKILESGRVAPEMDKQGNVKCFRAVNLSPKSVLKMAGLQPGDCILAVNDKVLDSPVVLLGIYERVLATGGPVTYVIERRGEKKKFQVEME